MDSITAVEGRRTNNASASTNAWDQRPGENDLWFARFLRYVALGPVDRSVSLVSKGRKNAYPIPAHWPIQAKQNEWKLRARAFDKAAQDSPGLIAWFNSRLASLSATIGNGEAQSLQETVKAGGYHSPPADGPYEDNDD